VAHHSRKRSVFFLPPSIRVIISVTVLATILVDLTMRIRAPQPGIRRPQLRTLDLPFAMLAMVEVLVGPTPARPLRPSVTSATAYATCASSTVATHATVAACSGAAACSATYADMTAGSTAHTADADCDRAGVR
jgi:hypothetical protein